MRLYTPWGYLSTVSSVIICNYRLSYTKRKTCGAGRRSFLEKMLREGKISVFINNIDAADENACGNEYQHGKYGGCNTREACPKVGEQHGEKQADDCEKY